MATLSEEFLRRHNRLAAIVKLAQSEVAAQSEKAVERLREDLVEERRQRESADRTTVDKLREVADEVSRSLLKRFGGLSIIYALIVGGAGALYIEKFVLTRIGETQRAVQIENATARHDIQALRRELQDHKDTIEELRGAKKEFASLKTNLNIMKNYLISNASNEISGRLEKLVLTQPNPNFDPERRRIRILTDFVKSLNPDVEQERILVLVEALNEYDRLFVKWLDTKRSDNEAIQRSKRTLLAYPRDSALKFRLLAGLATLENNKGAASEYTKRAYEMAARGSIANTLFLLKMRINWITHHLVHEGRYEEAVREFDRTLADLAQIVPGSETLGMAHFMKAWVLAASRSDPTLAVDKAGVLSALTEAHSHLIGCAMFDLIADPEATEFDWFKSELQVNGGNWRKELARLLDSDCR